MKLSYIELGVYVCATDRTYFKVNLEEKEQSYESLFIDGANVKGPLTTVRLENGKLTNLEEISHDQAKVIRKNAGVSIVKRKKSERLAESAETGDYAQMFEIIEPPEIVRIFQESQKVKDAFMGSPDVQALIATEIKKQVAAIVGAGDGSTAKDLVEDQSEYDDLGSDDKEDDLSILNDELGDEGGDDGSEQGNNEHDNVGDGSAAVGDDVFKSDSTGPKLNAGKKTGSGRTGKANAKANGK